MTKTRKFQINFISLETNKTIQSMIVETHKNKIEEVALFRQSLIKEECHAVWKEVK